MSVHHKFSPSSLSRLYSCPYSIKGFDLPSKDNEYSLEGTKLHDAIAVRSFEGLNDEQRYIVENCIAFEIELTKNSNGVFYEKGISIQDNGNELLSGTCDVVALYPDKVLVLDWKFGRGEVEEVENNLQLAAYALGLMQEFNKQTCEAYIYQPRIKHLPQSYTFTRPDLLLKTIKKIIAKCEVENPEINPGEKQCQYCRLKEHLQCPALKNELTTIDKTVNLPELSNEDLTKLYLRANVVDKYLNAIKEEFKHRIEIEGSCGGYIFKEYIVKSYTVEESIRKKITKIKE